MTKSQAKKKCQTPARRQILIARERGPGRESRAAPAAPSISETPSTPVVSYGRPEDAGDARSLAPRRPGRHTSTGTAGRSRIHPPVERRMRVEDLQAAHQQDVRQTTLIQWVTRTGTEWRRTTAAGSRLRDPRGARQCSFGSRGFAHDLRLGRKGDARRRLPERLRHTSGRANQKSWERRTPPATVNLPHSHEAIGRAVLSCAAAARVRSSRRS